MATVSAHWTAKSIDDFVYRISSDFVVQLEKKMNEENLSQKVLAERLGVSFGRVSQVLNNPGNLTLKNVVQYACILGMKVSLVAYNDGDPSNKNGPINSEIFYRCWQKYGSPTDFFSLTENHTLAKKSYSIRINYLTVFERKVADTKNVYEMNLRPTGLMEQSAATGNTIVDRTALITQGV